MAMPVNVAAAWKHILKYWKGLLVVKLYGFQFNEATRKEWSKELK